MSDYIDKVTGKDVSEANRTIIQNTRDIAYTSKETATAGKETAAASKETAAASKQTAAATKQIALNTQVTNVELKKLNNTAQEIAAANETLIAIQTAVINESSKQTALLDAQLQISKVNELEKNRQILIKQAAFSVENKIEEVLKNESPLIQYFYLKDQINQVEIVQLTSDALNEIIDKKYVKDVLINLHHKTAEAKEKLNPKQIKDIDDYYKNRNRLATCKYELENLINEIEKTKFNKTPASVSLIFSSLLRLSFFDNTLINKIINTVYYIILLFVVLVTLVIIPQSIGASIFWLLIQTIWILPLTYLNYRKISKKYTEEHSNKEYLIMMRDKLYNEIEQAELFDNDFNKEYSLG